MAFAQGVPDRFEGHLLDLERIHDFAVDVILEAGALIRQRAVQLSIDSRNATNASSSSSKVQIKSNEVDLVTELDVLIEDQIRARIEEAWPEHGIIAEESFGKNAGVKSKWQRGKVSDGVIPECALTLRCRLTNTLLD
jgi:hypothetical protein